MSDETPPQPGDMRFKGDDEILVYDGYIWAPYGRIPTPISNLALRGGQTPEPDQTAQSDDERTAGADD